MGEEKKGRVGIRRKEEKEGTNSARRARRGVSPRRGG